jgi:hypothetical protein
MACAARLVTGWELGRCTLWSARSRKDSHGISPGASATNAVANCRFQDGAATANNPAAVALAEARALWPDTPVDVLVSIGSGDTPPARRERSVSTYLETGAVLIESATDTERVAGALAALAPLVPGLRYFRCPAAPPACP